MSHFLQLLLDTPEPLFSTGLEKLERNNGNNGVDTRLIADIIKKSHDIMKYLKLDVRDTTGQELYLALNEVVKRGDSESLLVDSDYVLVAIDNIVISFNLIDVIENMHHELPYGNNSVSHGRRSLRGELVNRYISHGHTDKNTIRETATLIGLLPESDTWYNNCEYQQKPKNYHKESVL